MSYPLPDAERALQLAAQALDTAGVKRRAGGVTFTVAERIGILADPDRYPTLINPPA